MTTDKRNFASISGRITHGTARQVTFNSLIPLEKSEKELFWTKILLQNLINKLDLLEIIANTDDSNGNHDVILSLINKTIIGVQVTEFTYELERSRKYIQDTYLKRIIQEISNRGCKATKKTLFCITFPYVDSRKPASEKPRKVVDSIEKLLNDSPDRRIYKFDYGNIFFNEIQVGDFYVPNINNIGVDVNFDNLPRNLDIYLDCVDSIFVKKSNSLSDWLLIWSIDFWKDKHWLGNEIIEHMKDQFAASNFKKVFFMETCDGEGIFQANLKLHVIK